LIGFNLINQANSVRGAQIDWLDRWQVNLTIVVLRAEKVKAFWVQDVCGIKASLCADNRGSFLPKQLVRWPWVCQLAQV